MAPKTFASIVFFLSIAVPGFSVEAESPASSCKQEITAARQEEQKIHDFILSAHFKERQRLPETFALLQDMCMAMLPEIEQSLALYPQNEYANRTSELSKPLAKELFHKEAAVFTELSSTPSLPALPGVSKNTVIFTPNMLFEWKTMAWPKPVFIHFTQIYDFDSGISSLLLSAPTFKNNEASFEISKEQPLVIAFTSKQCHPYLKTKDLKIKPIPVATRKGLKNHAEAMETAIDLQRNIQKLQEKIKIIELIPEGFQMSPEKEEEEKPSKQQPRIFYNSAFT